MFKVYWDDILVVEQLSQSPTVELHTSEKYTERVQKLRAEYWTTIGEINLADLIFIDEIGVNIAITRCFARSPQSSRAYSERPDGRGKNVAMTEAMSE